MADFSQTLNQPAKDGSTQKFRIFLYFLLSMLFSAPLFAQEIQELIKKAEQGDADAQFSLGQIYSKGSGVPKNEQETFKWIKKSAEQNHPLAQTMLGNMYISGYGVDKSIGDGVKWLEKAAENEEPTAQYTLGDLFSKGDGVTKDFKRALELWKKAAEQGIAPAQYKVGLAYFLGKDFPQDFTEAYFWLHLAASDSRFEKAKNEAAAKITPAQCEEIHIKAKKWLKDLDEKIIERFERRQKAKGLSENGEEVTPPASANLASRLFVAIAMEQEITVDALGQIDQNQHVVLPDSGLARGSKKHWFKLRKTAVSSGAEIESIANNKDEFGDPLLLLTFTEAGARKIEQATQTHTGLSLAIILDDTVVVSWMIQGPLSSGKIPIHCRDFGAFPNSADPSQPLPLAELLLSPRPPVENPIFQTASE